MSRVEGAGNLTACYQCSACVAECPAAQLCGDFNPRLIVLAALLGVGELLVEKDSVIWQCTTCYKCYERCPQGTHPIEVITACKNLAAAIGNAPEEITALHDTVAGNATLIMPSAAIEKRRGELGLGPVPAPAEDLERLLE
ncbi:MAG: 4Fe-4S dicluster domain-containing protein [Actinomycetota bacterium]